MKLALLGSPSAPKLFNSLQIAYGLCGSWDRIIVLGSSPKDTQYQHMGSYNTLLTASDAPPQRYTELLNLCGACNKEVIIFSTFSDQWSGGVMPHLQASYYEELLRSHRFFLHILRHFPRHVIACVDTRKRLSYLDDQRKPRLQFRELSVQQEGFERDFTSVLQVDKKGMMSVLKDLTRILPENQSFKVTPQIGAALQDWCTGGEPVIPFELQRRIDGCNSLTELYRLMFDLDIEDEMLFSAFTRRRLELEDHYTTGDTHSPDESLTPIPGGLL